MGRDYEQLPVEGAAPYQAYPPQAYGAPPQAYGAPPQAYGAPPQPTYGTQPAYGSGPEPTFDNQGKFPSGPRYRDLPFAILFVLHLAAIAVLTGVSYKHEPAVVPPATNSTTYYYSNSTAPTNGGALDIREFYVDLSKVLATVLGAAAAAIVFSFLYITVVKRFARQMIVITLIASVVFWVVIAAVALIKGLIIFGVILLVVALLHGVIWYMWRSRIPFAQAMLESVSHVLLNYSAPSYVSYASGLVLFGWTALWMATVIFCQKYEGNSNLLLTFFLLLSYYWTTQVVKNVVHVTTSGLFASHFFYAGSPNGMPSNPTMGALRRAVTTSFGSICLGSLIVALIKTIRQIVQNAGRNSRNGFAAFVACIAVCLLGILDNLMRYFNMYAFTQVAIYGKSFCEAAKDTWSLIKTNGVDAIINDNLISGVLLMGVLLGGVFSAVAGAIIGLAIMPNAWIILAIFSFIVGACLVTLSMEVIESGVATTLVCFIMEPAVLQRNNPELYARFMERFPGVVRI